MIEALLYQPTSQHRAMYDLEGDTMPETFVHVAAGTRPAYWFSGSQFTFIVTSEEAGGSYCAMELLVWPGTGPGPHLHEDADEQFYVIEGDLTYTIAGQTFPVTTGDILFIPRNTLHSFKNGAAPARMLATFTPGGNDRYFIEHGIPVDDSYRSVPPS